MKPNSPPERLCPKCRATELKNGQLTCDYCRYSVDTELWGKLPYEIHGR